MEIPYDDVNFVWVTSHYDIHWEGMCRYNGKLCKFRTHDNTDYTKQEEACPYCSQEDPPESDWKLCNCGPYNDLTCEITPLTFKEKCQWLSNMWLFEGLVGKHWSNNNRLFSTGLRSERSMRFYYWLQKTKIFEYLFGKR